MEEVELSSSSLKMKYENPFLRKMCMKFDGMDRVNQYTPPSQ